MKAVMVMFDPLSRHVLPPYGCDRLHAPSFARPAGRSVTFDSSYRGRADSLAVARQDGERRSRE